MSGIPKIEIIESVETLKELLKQQKSSMGFAKVQSLYLLKIQQVETVRHLSVILGRTERTLHRWLSLYREAGLFHSKKCQKMRKSIATESFRPRHIGKTGLSVKING